MPTALEFITEAYQIAGVLGFNETANSWQAQQGLTAFNDMIELNNLDRAMIYAVEQNSFPVVSGQSAYTIGIGGDFNIARPVEIDFLVYQLNGVNFPLQKINNQDYASIPWQQGGFPQYFYYEAGFPLGTINIFGVPTTGNFLVSTWTPLATFPTLTTNLAFPPGYNVMFKYNLADYLAGRNGMQLTPSDKGIAVKSMAQIKSRNLPTYVMKTEIAYLQNNFGTRGWYN
jgi:hypothetical protein